MVAATVAPAKAASFVDVFDDDIAFAENYLWIRTKVPVGSSARGGAVRLIPNVAQRYLYENWSHRLLILKARQLGCSTWVQARMFRETATRAGIRSVTVSHDPESTKSLYGMSHTFYENLSASFRPWLRYDSVHYMEFGGLRSSLSISSANKRFSGRGSTTHNVHASELAFWPWPDETLNGILESVPDNPSTNVVIESTPNGAFGYFYELCKAAMEGRGNYRLLFLPWWLDSGYQIPVLPGERIDYDPDELALVTKHGLFPEQIKWRRKKIEDFESRGEGEVFYQEYAEDPESCFLAGGNCYFDSRRLRTILKQCPGSPLRRDGHFYIWHEPVPGREYVMGVDTASGNEGDDYSAAVVRDWRTNERVATLDELIDPFELAEEVVRIGARYNGAMLGIERNGMGLATVGAVGKLGYEHLYWSSPNHCGWTTSQTTRPVMLADLRQEIISEIPPALNDERLVQEMMRFVKGVGVNGVPAAGKGAHDDMVIADAIAGQMRKVDVAGSWVG